MLRTLLLLVGATVVTSQISAQQQLTSSGRAEIDAYLEQAVEQSKIPGLVAIVTSADGELYRGAFGLADVARGRAMSDDAIHNIASMTKPITSAVVMMLAEEGRLGLDEPIEDHLPGVVPTEDFAIFDPATGQFTSRPAETPVTIRQLL